MNAIMRRPCLFLTLLGANRGRSRRGECRLVAARPCFQLRVQCNSSGNVDTIPLKGRLVSRTADMGRLAPREASEDFLRVFAPPVLRVDPVLRPDRRRHVGFYFDDRTTILALSLEGSGSILTTS
jgi:hypothetical protein